jgi:hypothetical protein
MNIEESLSEVDVEDALLRLHLTPDGRDTWIFNVRMTLTFSNNDQRNYAWNAVRLDERAPDRTLTMAGARIL